jgi:hypothetical protein
LRVREEAAVLAVHWKLLERVGIENGGRARKVTPIELGERLCAAFESYLACSPQSGLEIEHLLLLARGIERADTIALSQCNTCQALILVDLLGPQRRLCSHCKGMAETPVPVAAQSSAPMTGESLQQELF